MYKQKSVDANTQAPVRRVVNTPAFDWCMDKMDTKYVFHLANKGSIIDLLFPNYHV